MKEKVAVLVGNLEKFKWCLFEGLQHPDIVQTTHCLRRELASMNKPMFERLQNAIGSIILTTKNTLERQLRLDSPDNQDQMTASMHLLFDGTRGIGSGGICLLPLRLKYSLKRIADNPHMSARQWFPEDTNLFYLHLFQGEGPIAISHRGPPFRAYEDLPTGLEFLEEDLDTLALQGRLPDYIVPCDDPNGIIAYYILNPTDSSIRLFIVRSHMNVANVLADAATKLLYRMEVLQLTFKGADNYVFKSLWPTIGHWVKEGVDPPKPSRKPPKPTPDPDRDAVRRSERLMDARTEPAPQTKPKASVPKRKVDSAPTILGMAGATRKRSYGKISGASEAKPSQRRASATRSKATTSTTTPKSSTRRAATKSSSRRSSTTATRSSARLASASKTEEPESDSSEPPKKKRNFLGNGKRL
ncbi:uncharacterized protein SCHCODRAFT_02522900 [Schizophyllum commune H4-8]|nr:uncharacterized protein SCHCODRAFT_02522900 [Schizophyllum commune H4-8]KAI5900713.1 hypothetical protein SCHCODRAFT_02522900 [Schizophyllum commune H4-8]